MSKFIGGFITKLVPGEDSPQLHGELADFHPKLVVELDGDRIRTSADLMEAVFTGMGLVPYSPHMIRPLDNWDAFFDYLWGWAHLEGGKDTNWLMFIINRGGSLLSHSPELAFQFAEICCHLHDSCRDRQPLGLHVYLLM